VKETGNVIFFIFIILKRKYDSLAKAHASVALF
jgi:hypothetical protein